MPELGARAGEEKSDRCPRGRNVELLEHPEHLRDDAPNTNETGGVGPVCRVAVPDSPVNREVERDDERSKFGQATHGGVFPSPYRARLRRHHASEPRPIARIITRFTKRTSYFSSAIARLRAPIG